MIYVRGMLAGLFVWLCVSVSFYVLEHIPLIKDFFFLQAFIVMIAISTYAFLGEQFYYKRAYKTKGLFVGILMSGTALLLDAFITVPFVEIPNGRSYKSFFSSPVLWILVLITVFAVYFYWRRKIKPN